QRTHQRCAGGTLPTNDGGSHRQAHPLVSTYTIAVNTIRGFAGARPPPCGRSLTSGIKGSTSSHNSSGTNRHDNASTTMDDHPGRRVKIQTRHALIGFLYWGVGVFYVVVVVGFGGGG